MLKFSQLEPMVEYYRIFKDGSRSGYKVRVNNDGSYETLSIQKDSLWSYSCESYNNLVLNSTFEPCEWVPKLHERIYLPNPYSGVDGLLCDTFYWIDSIDRQQIKKNVGVYRTAAEAHARSLELGWTL